MSIEIKIFLAVIASILAFIGNISYIKDVFKGRVVPHPYTWFIWSIVSLVTFFGQWQKGAGIGALPTAIAEAFTIIIFVYATYRYIVHVSLGKRDRYRSASSTLHPAIHPVQKVDHIYLIIALLGLIPWALTKDPTISVIIVVTIDVIAFIPTLRKAKVHPETEQPTLYAMNVTRHILGLFSLQAYNIATTLHSIAMICTNSLMVWFIKSKNISESRHCL